MGLIKINARVDSSRVAPYELVLVDLDLVTSVDSHPDGCRVHLTTVTYICDKSVNSFYTTHVAEPDGICMYDEDRFMHFRPSEDDGEYPDVFIRVKDVLSVGATSGGSIAVLSRSTDVVQRFFSPLTAEQMIREITSNLVPVVEYELIC